MNFILSHQSKAYGYPSTSLWYFWKPFFLNLIFDCLFIFSNYIICILWGFFLFFFFFFFFWVEKKCQAACIHHQIRSVAQSCPTLCDPMNHSTPGLPVHHHLPEFTQTHVHRVDDAIQPSHPLSSPSPLAPNPSQHQSLFQ